MPFQQNPGEYSIILVCQKSHVLQTSVGIAEPRISLWTFTLYARNFSNGYIVQYGTMYKWGEEVIYLIHMNNDI